MTPFRDGELDEPSLRRLVRHYAAGPVDGLILAATSGEGMSLGIGELERLVTMRATKYRPAGAHTDLPRAVGREHRTRCCDALDETAAWPIDGYLIASPYYTRPSQRGLLQHFTALADHASWPIALYNIPYRCAVNIDNETLLQLAQHPNIIGLKDCSADRAQSIDLLRRRPAGFRVLTGEDAQYHDALIDGADGAILLSAHVETEAFAAVRTLLRQATTTRAQACREVFRTDPAVVRRAEPGAGQVLAGAHRTDRQRRGAAADGRGERGTGGPARRGDRAAHAAAIAAACMTKARRRKRVDGARRLPLNGRVRIAC